MNASTCDGARRREATYSSNDTSCEPTPEQSEAAKRKAEADAEREAEAKRDAYFSSGADVGGRSAASGASDASVYGQQCDDDPKLRDSMRTAAIDKPIQSDALGNALVSALAGGIIGGVRAAAAESAAGAGGRSVVSHVAETTGKKLIGAAARDAGMRVAHQAAAEVERRSAAQPGSVPTSPRPESPADGPSTAGMSSAHATSQTAPEPTSSEASPAPVGRDRVPYAPGAAPVRVPEAATNAGSAPVVIRG